MIENLYKIWMSFGFIYFVYQFLIISPHMKKGHELSFWTKSWVFKPEALDEKGQKIRFRTLIFVPVYILVAFVLILLK